MKQNSHSQVKPSKSDKLLDDKHEIGREIKQIWFKARRLKANNDVIYLFSHLWRICGFLGDVQT